MQRRGWDSRDGGWAVAFGLVGVLMVAPGKAEATTLVLGEATAAPGQSQVALPVSVAITSGQLITMLAWDVTYDPAIVDWEELVVDPAVAALGKQVHAYELSPGLVRLVLYGLDRQAFTSGALAECRLRVLPQALAGSTLVGVSAATAANGNGGDLPLGTADGRVWVEVSTPTPPPADTTPPVLTLTSPADNAQLAFGAAVTVAGTATDNDALAAVTVKGAAVSLQPDGSFSQALTELGAGAHTIAVVATDTSGNAVTLTRTVTIAQPPAPPSGALTVPAALMTNRSSPWLVKGTDLTYWSANVWVEQQVDFGAGGVWGLGLSAMNQNNGGLGLPGGYTFNLTVAIDGAYKGTLKVPGSTTAFQQGALNLTAPAGVHTVRFTWTNDYWLANLYDANLRLKEASFVPGGIAMPPAAMPSVTIVSPAQGSTVSTSTQTLKFEVSNFALGLTKGHLHIQVDNGATWHVYSTTPLLLSNLRSGPHQVKITLVDTSHNAINGTTTPVTTTFTVQ